VTAQGKARASRNARRHGLSVPVHRASAVAADIEEFALQLVGDAASRTEIDLARAVAEAQLELVRIHYEKQLVLTSSVSSPEIMLSSASTVTNGERSREENGRSADCQSSASSLSLDEGVKDGT